MHQVHKSTCPLRPQYVHTLWAPPGVRVGRPSFLVHGWFLNVRASEALSHQSFAIPRSLKTANVTLRVSSYLKNSKDRNLRNRSNASSAPVADYPVLPPKKYIAGLLYISKTRGPHTYNPKPTTSSTDKNTIAHIQVTKYTNLPILYATPTPPEDTGY
ncbi:hypothetical protein M9H77_09020 [Catharanthus roseus]|uniref:Uncharacterized protein n=1 Tax=Catharanthus roseus TaxID=4058 RepID=A0ACC0BZI6_CATRO|nr:hypothetical protein M9H77_09020 [Catharanthus roseus]